MAHSCRREESSGNDDIAIEIEDPHIPLVTSSMEKKLESLHPLSSECCIYRVPKKLRKINEEAYTPLRVSIGPFHHGKEGLEAMEEHKWRYLQNFLQRSQKGLAEFVQVVKNKEERIRQCYDETIPFGSDEFVEIILVDAAFIIEVLVSCGFPNKDEDDPIFGKSRMDIEDIYRDLIMLENQLPFFILVDLFQKANIKVPSEQHEISVPFIKFASVFFMYFLIVEEKIDFGEVKHFTDMVRICLKPSKRRLKPQRKQEVKPRGKQEAKFIHLHCSTELDEAGVKFKASTSKNLFDIKFEKGVLEIPRLRVLDETEYLLRNLLAFEQCHCVPRDRYMSDYVTLVDGLINTHKDVELLVRSKVIESWLGDSENVSTLFNKLAHEILFDGEEFYFMRLQEQLDDYCHSRWHKWKANLNRDYFKSPWAVISIIAAVVLLILTVIQTVCSIISVAHGNN